MVLDLSLSLIIGGPVPEFFSVIGLCCLQSVLIIKWTSVSYMCTNVAYNPIHLISFFNVVSPSLLKKLSVNVFILYYELKKIVKIPFMFNTVDLVILARFEFSRISRGSINANSRVLRKLSL